MTNKANTFLGGLASGVSYLTAVYAGKITNTLLSDQDPDLIKATISTGFTIAAAGLGTYNLLAHKNENMKHFGLGFAVPAVFSAYLLLTELEPTEQLPTQETQNSLAL